jgi:hypothetical protein
MTRVIAVSATTGALALAGGPAAGLAWGGDDGGWDHFRPHKRVVLVCKKEFRHREFRRDRFRFDDFRRDRFRFDRRDRVRFRCIEVKRHHWSWNGDDDDE